MARKSPRLTVRTAPSAATDLAKIWSWNAHRYDVEHADKYIKFLGDETEKLGTDYVHGRPVPNRPEYQFVVVRKGRGHGHIVVYWVRVSVVEVVHYFHTAQDWQSLLNTEDEN